MSLPESRIKRIVRENELTFIRELRGSGLPEDPFMEVVSIWVDDEEKGLLVLAEVMWGDSEDGLCRWVSRKVTQPL